MAFDLDAIRQRHPLPGVVGASVKLKRKGNEWVACCPFHADRTPSFTIFAGGQRYHCFGCGSGGDVLDYVQQARGVGLREAVELLGEGVIVTVPVIMPAVVDEPDRSDEARAIWQAAAPIRGTLADTYLRTRGISIPLPDSLRFARLRYGTKGPLHPVLVALVESVGGEPCGIQRTYLNEAGTGKAAVAKAKLSLGKVKGGAIRLAPPAAELMVCEGLEDGLSLQQTFARAVWVAAGATMLPGMRFPFTVLSIVIGADADEAGEREARKAGEAFAAANLSARIIRPLEGWKDFNAELQGASA